MISSFGKIWANAAIGRRFIRLDSKSLSDIRLSRELPPGRRRKELRDTGAILTLKEKTGDANRETPENT